MLNIEMQNQQTPQDLTDVDKTVTHGPGIKETPLVNVMAYVRIFDPETQETVLETRA